MSVSSEEELVGVIYTELLKKSVPCYTSEICDRVPGLRRRQEVVARLLQTMCENGIAVNVRGKYILKDKMTPELDENSAHLTYDGPAYGITCTTNQREADERISPVHSASRAVVPVQQLSVQRSSSSDSTCENADLQVHTDNLTRIVDLLKDCSGAVKAKDIAQRTGIGQSKSNVNRYLYFLKQQNVIQDNGRAEWTFSRDVKGDDLRVYAAQLARIPGGKSKGKPPPPPGSSNNTCEFDCPNAGPGCVHVTNNFQQNIHHHYHNIQVGEHNKILADLHPDGAPPGSEQHR